MTFEEKVNFLATTDEPGNIAEPRSTLNLLRSDINTCLDYLNGRYNSPKAIWPGLMVIFAGIDLTAKFYYDNDDNIKNKRYYYPGSRFKEYLQDAMNLSETDSEKVYQCRNSFMHSFGLYSQDRNGKYFVHPRMEDSYVINVSIQTGKAIHFKIGIKSLHGRFEQSIQVLQRHLLGQNKMPDNFDELFNKYGTDKPLFENDWLKYCGIVIKT